MVVPRLRTVPPLAARCSAPADFASLRVLGAPAASRPPLLTSSLVALPASLGSSYRPALRWPGIPGLRSASRCPHPFTPSGLRRLRPVSRTARGLRAPRLRRPSVPALRTALAFGGAVFRRCGRLLGVSSRLQPLRGLRRSQARLWLSLLHWAYYGLFPPLAAAFVRPCASLARCSVPAHFVCSALQPFGPSPFRKRLHPQFAIVDLHLRTVPPSVARCSVAAHCASLRVLATSTLRVSDARKLACSSRCSLGLLSAASPTGRALRAPHKKCQK